MVLYCLIHRVWMDRRMDGWEFNFTFAWEVELKIKKLLEAEGLIATENLGRNLRVTQIYAT